MTFFEALQRTSHRQIFQGRRPVLDDGPDTPQQTHVAVHELPPPWMYYFHGDVSTMQCPSVHLRDASASEDPVLSLSLGPRTLCSLMIASVHSECGSTRSWSRANRRVAWTGNKSSRSRPLAQLDEGRARAFHFSEAPGPPQIIDSPNSHHPRRPP